MCVRMCICMLHAGRYIPTNIHTYIERGKEKVNSSMSKFMQIEPKLPPAPTHISQGAYTHVCN